MSAATLGASIEVLQIKSFFLNRSRPAWPDRHYISSAIVMILGNSNVDSDVSNPVLNSPVFLKTPPPPMPFLWSHNSSGKIAKSLHSYIVNCSAAAIFAKFTQFQKTLRMSDLDPKCWVSAMQQAKQNFPIFSPFFLLNKKSGQWRRPTFSEGSSSQNPPTASQVSRTPQQVINSELILRPFGFHDLMHTVTTMTSWFCSCKQFTRVNITIADRNKGNKPKHPKLRPPKEKLPPQEWPDQSDWAEKWVQVTTKQNKPNQTKVRVQARVTTKHSFVVLTSRVGDPKQVGLKWRILGEMA